MVSNRRSNTAPAAAAAAASGHFFNLKKMASLLLALGLAVQMLMTAPMGAQALEIRTRMMKHSQPRNLVDLKSQNFVQTS